MDNFTSLLLELWHDERLWSALRALILLVVGLIAARWASRGITRLLARVADAAQQLLLRRALYYGLSTLVVVATLQELGFDLSVLLGAAGLVTVALGFASQTSASNLISGLFLIAERAFVVGDFVRVGTTEGEVVSIDLLSTKLRTADNLMVRIPNETVMKSEMTNFTRFPIRRLDIEIGVAYREDLAEVRRVLLDVADREPSCLDEPAPQVWMMSFGDSALNLRLLVWTRREGFVQFRTTMQEKIKAAFDHHRIEIPFPQRTLQGGGGPLEIRLSRAPKAPAEAATTAGSATES